MHNPVRIILYSSSAIVLLVLLWGFRQIPEQGRLADRALRESLNQEMIVLNGAVKSATQAMKYRLLDVLKAEGNDHSTRTFQDSPFLAAALFEWDQVQWKSNWFSVKTKTVFQNDELKTWLKEWPLSKLTLEDVHFTKVADIEGQPYFAILVPVRKPNMVPMVGVGIFPANQFGLDFSAEENRELRVFTQDGIALALSHPAYLGSSLKSEPLVHEILSGDEVSLRHEWKSDHGAMIGMASHIPDSNLLVAIETRAQPVPSLPAWLYLLLSALGAAVLNWVLFKGVFGRVVSQLEHAESTNEQLRRVLSERSVAREKVEIEPIPVPAPVPRAVTTVSEPEVKSEILSTAELPSMDFTTGPVEPTGPVDIEQVVNASLRALRDKTTARGIRVTKFGLEELKVSGDTLQLQTAIEEVFKNAIEAMENSAKCELTISGREEKGVLSIIVQDTGQGIPQNDVAKVFDPFFSTKDSEGVSRGLGLNVVRRVVEEMNGRVTLTSDQDDKTHGTRVEISFPVNAEAAVALELDFIEDEEPTKVSGPRLTPETTPPLMRWDVIRKPKVRTLD